MSTETPSTFRDVMAYVERFQHDVGQLVALIEKLMGEAGYEGLPAYKNQACWQLTSHWRYPDRWRARYIARLYVEMEREEYTSALPVLVNFGSDTDLDFCPIICGKYDHSPLSDDAVGKHVFNSSEVCSLARSEQDDWEQLRERNGWCIAEPRRESPIRLFQGYILNAFELVDADAVADNIIRPLTHPDENLDDMLTVTKYRFPAMDADEQA